MITKEKIADQVIKAPQGGEITSFRKLDPREVYEAIEKARNALMQGILDQGGILDGEFVTQYKHIAVQDDAVTYQKYSILPTRLVSFSDKEGIQQVSPMKNQAESFIRVSSGFQAIYGNLEAGKLNNKVGYYPERVKVGTDQSLRIYYTNCHLMANYPDVMIKMIASTYDFDDNEALPIPAAYEQQLVSMVFSELGIQISTPLDVKNDSQPLGQ